MPVVEARSLKTVIGSMMVIALGCVGVRQVTIPPDPYAIDETSAQMASVPTRWLGTCIQYGTVMGAQSFQMSVVFSSDRQTARVDLSTSVGPCASVWSLVGSEGEGVAVFDERIEAGPCSASLNYVNLSGEDVILVEAKTTSGRLIARCDLQAQ